MKKNVIYIMFIIMFLFLSIGHATVNDVVFLLNGEVSAATYEGIFISECRVYYEDDDLNDDLATADIIKIDNTNLTSSIDLDKNNKDSFITYFITISNTLDKDYLFDDVKYILEKDFYDNPNIVFELDGLKKYDRLSSNGSLSFKIKFHYADYTLSENNILNSLLNFSFKEAYNITYENINNNGYPVNIMQGDSTTITFVNDVPEGVFVKGVENYNYNYETGVLTLTNALDNIVVSNAVVFRHDGEYVFDGTNYIDTGVCLFNEENFYKNFEVSFSIVNKAETQVEKATLFNALDEVNPDYPGVLFRVTNNLLNYEVLGNNKANGLEQINNLHKFEDITKVKLLRVNSITYYSVNDGDFYELQDFTVFNEFFDIPATFGASLDSNGELWRFFVGTLKDMKIKYLEDDYEIESFEVEYSSVTSIAFDGTNYVDTGVYLFNEENINKDFDIIFTINSYAAKQNVYATLMNAMDEANTTFYGVLFRVFSTSTDISNDVPFAITKYQLVSNALEKKNVNTDDLTPKRIRIIRRSGIIYYSFNYGELIQLQDFTGVSETFDVPVTFGASLDADKNPYRYFKGTLSYMEVRIKK